MSISTPLSANLESITLAGSNYGYSATPLNLLADGATEWTNAVLAVDGSGSTTGFRREMQDAVGQIIVGCQRNPRADNMQLRVVEFDHQIREEHGFIPLAQCNPGDYANFMIRSGGTALYDCSDNAVASLIAESQRLKTQKYTSNGIAVVVTDGYDEGSSLPMSAVKTRVDAAMQSEALESMVLILVGLNPRKDQVLKQKLDAFAQASGFRYIDISELTPKKFAKLADFISKSISAQSQALGTGGPSQPINASLVI